MKRFKDIKLKGNYVTMTSQITGGNYASMIPGEVTEATLTEVIKQIRLSDISNEETRREALRGLQQ